jgi:hypothetical protein
MNFVNDKLVGTEINGLKIIKYINNGKRQYFECTCMCGKNFTTRTDGIKIGAVKSCGCITGDLISQKNRLPDNLGSFNLVLRYYKGNAKKRNLEFQLSLEEFRKFIFDKCNYCGSEPTLSTFVSSQKNRRNKEIICNGIDRMDNSIGYMINNCITCCSICNGAKSNLSYEEFQNWIRKLVSVNNGK